MGSSGASGKWCGFGGSHDYPTEYKVRDKRGDWHVQCDCIMLVTVRKAEEWTQAELEVKSSYMDLFGVDSSQSQSQSQRSPPPCRHKKREERHAHSVNSSSEEEYDEDGDGDGGGKRGGGGGGGGEHKKGK